MLSLFLVVQGPESHGPGWDREPGQAEGGRVMEMGLQVWRTTFLWLVVVGAFDTESDAVLALGDLL